jgi:putative spermidine/putrescine transport system permease protein
VQSGQIAAGRRGQAPRPAAADWRITARRWLPLLPSVLLVLGLFLYPMIGFLRFSFDIYRQGELVRGFTLAAYREFLRSSYDWLNVLTSIKLALAVTIATIVVGYPVAYAIMTIRSPAGRRWALIAIISPLVVSVVVRAYGWQILLTRQGAVNFLLLHLHITRQPLALINNFTGVVIATVHVLLPFMVFPILTALGQVETTLKEAAADLGASRWVTFSRVTWPLTRHGLAAGAQLVFPLALSAYVTPQLLGGGRVLVLSTLIYQSTVNVDWPTATVASIVLMILTVMANLALLQLMRRGGRASALRVR